MLPQLVCTIIDHRFDGKKKIALHLNIEFIKDSKVHFYSHTVTATDIVGVKTYCMKQVIKLRSAFLTLFVFLYL